MVHTRTMSKSQTPIRRKYRYNRLGTGLYGLLHNDGERYILLCRYEHTDQDTERDVTCWDYAFTTLEVVKAEWEAYGNLEQTMSSVLWVTTLGEYRTLKDAIQGALS